jgi:hypothetical protein
MYNEMTWLGRQTGIERSSRGLFKAASILDLEILMEIESLRQIHAFLRQDLNQVSLQFVLDAFLLGNQL